MAPSLRPWADLHADLFLPIVNLITSPRDYVSVRAVCTAWRSALPSVPQSPSLLVLDVFQPRNGARFITHAYALPTPMQRTFRLPKLPCHNSYISGSSNGYLTIADGHRLGLLNPVTGEKVKLLPLPNIRYPHRLVLGPNPRPDDYTVVAVCHHYIVAKVAYVTSQDTEWTISHIATDGAKLVDLVYGAERGDVYCLDERGDVQILHIPIPQGDRFLAERVVGPHFDTPASLTTPYDIIAKRISFKRLFLCEGTLYQVWQNTTGTIIKFRLPAGGLFTMPLDDILVIRYYPGRLPRWDAVKDLGGYSVFIDGNNAVAVQDETVPGVRPNCVYWIDCWLPWVFDMSNKTSTRCVRPPCDVGLAMGWYFNSD